MEAKETVMSHKAMVEIQNNSKSVSNELLVINTTAKAQAEITWNKAIREVVEFIENNALRATYMADPSKECWGISDYELAKIKELGIE